MLDCPEAEHEPYLPEVPEQSGGRNDRRIVLIMVAVECNKTVYQM